MRSAHRLAVWVLASIPALPLVASAQDVGSVEESRLLRAAAAEEAQGDFADAEALLEELLDGRPASSGGLFALERVLRAQGRVGDVLPRADAYLALEPRSAGARYLKLRVLAEVDSVSGLEAAVDAWIEADPRSVEAYREGARVLEDAVGPDRALELLERGAAALGEGDALSVERGAVLLRAGDPAGAVDAWSGAIGPEGAEVAAVLRRVERVEDAEARRDLAARLVDALDADPTTVARRRVGVRVALEAGMIERALALADRIVPALDRTARRGFLSDLARQGEEGSAPAVSLWAYERLREETGDAREARALDVRIASAALQAGDTEAAVAAQTRLARALQPGSTERRRVVADLIRGEAGSASPEELERRLEAFRSEFPDAPETDALVASVASSLLARGLTGPAVAVLEGVEGPRSGLERAYLRFADGDLEAGKEALSGALAGLEAERATETIQLVSLMDALGPGAQEVLAEAAVLEHRGRAGEAVRVLEERLEGLPVAERPPLVAHAARVADGAGRPEEAARLRTRLLDAHPDAAEVPEAALALARYRASRPGGVGDAVALLERIILENPTSPVVPAARRELTRLRDAVPGGRP